MAPMVAWHYSQSTTLFDFVRMELEALRNKVELHVNEDGVQKLFCRIYQALRREYNILSSGLVSYGTLWDCEVERWVCADVVKTCS